MLESLTSWYVEFVILMIIWIILGVIKRKFPQFWPKKILVLDVMLVFVIFGLHSVSVAWTGLSILPFMAFAASAYGLVLTLYLIYKEDDFRFKRFFVTYWRTLDIIGIGTYFIMIFIQSAKFLGII